VPLVRPFTLAESIRLVALAGHMRGIDAGLADLTLRLAAGDDSALPEFHDRLTVIGRPELADRLRALVARD
jgi:hypothetical protein